MSLFILDTDIVTLHQRNHPQAVAKIQAHAPEELAITVITVEEQMRGRLAQLSHPNQNAILVTRNRRDFERVPGLTLEDWSQ
jgi:tRNA(fMet)-specific endonuclease VapC